MTARLYDPIDRTAAEQVVDEALANASETYRANNRDHMIRNEAVFQRFAREERELKAHRAAGQSGARRRAA